MKMNFTKLFLFLLLVFGTKSNLFSGFTQFYTQQPDVKNCKEGLLLEEEKTKVLNYVNNIRAIHGLKPVVYDKSYDMKAAKSALLTAANEQLSHQPPQNWSCWSQDGYTGSENSNLFVQWYMGSQTIPCEYSVRSWMIDNKIEACGHRRWIIDPFLKFIAFGRADGASKNQGMNIAGMSIYVISNDKQDISDWNSDFVAYPFQNYPIDLYYTDLGENWYLSFTAIFDKTNYWNNQAVDYKSATIEVKTESGQKVNIASIKTDNDGYGVPNCIKWLPSSDLIEETKYLVTIKNVKYKGNTKDFSYWFKLTSEPVGNLPEVATLNTPANGAKNQDTKVTLKWNAAKDADSYYVMLAMDSQFETIVFEDDVVGTSVEVSGLIEDSKYYWQVFSRNMIGDADASNIWSFTTKAAGPGITILSNPPNNATDISTVPKLIWNKNSKAESYNLQVSNSNAFSPTTLFIDAKSIVDTFYIVPANKLYKNSTYYWRVSAKNSVGTGEYSSIYTFRTGNSTDILEENSNDAWIYPNPTSNYAIIELTEQIETTSAIKIFDINGNETEISIQKVDNNKYQLDLASLSNGIYSVRVLFDNKYYYAKLNVVK